MKPSEMVEEALREDNGYTPSERVRGCLTAIETMTKGQQEMALCWLAGFNPAILAEAMKVAERTVP